jgi:E3 ubiquitin-protein ligase RNF115/126
MNTITSSSSNHINSNPSLGSPSKYWCFVCEKEFLQNITTPSEVFCPECGGISELIENNDDPRQFKVYDSQAENSQAPSGSSNQQSGSPTQSQNQPRSRFAIISEVREGPFGRVVVQTVVPTNQQGAQNQNPLGELLTTNPFANFLNPMFSGLMMPGMGMGDLESRLIEEFLRNDPNRYGAPPASAESLSQLKETKFCEESCHSKECTICQEDYKKDESVLHLPCEHNFHKNCATEWLTRHNSCPICRKPLDQPVDNNQS